jgi:two-component system, NarL family, response regulator DevR
MSIQVLIVDDHAIFRRGLRSLLAEEPDIEVVGELDNGVEALAAVGRLGPEVVTLDIRLGGLDGIQVTRQLLQQHPQLRVIILTTYEDDEYLLGALQAGAHAYLLKNSSYDTLADTIRAVQRGQRLLAPELVHRVIDEYCRVSQEKLRSEIGLSEQEIEVLRLLASGATSRDIADRLFWSEVTVKRKVQDITDKLHATNRVQAVAEAVRRGII